MESTSSRIDELTRRGLPYKTTTTATFSGGNPYLNMTINDLVSAKRQIDEAWTAVLQMVQ